MTDFDFKTFSELAAENHEDLMGNLTLAELTLSTAGTAYYSREFHISLSLAIIPNIIKLIKNAVTFALALSFCVLTLGSFADMNKIALELFANLFICVANIALSLVVPFIRTLRSLAQGGYNAERSTNKDDYCSDDQSLSYLTWQVQTDTNSCPLLSNAERYVFGL